MLKNCYHKAVKKIDAQPNCLFNNPNKADNQKKCLVNKKSNPDDEKSSTVNNFFRYVDRNNCLTAYLNNLLATLNKWNAKLNK